MSEYDIEKQLKGTMEFYVRTYFQVNKDKFLENARKTNIYGLDPDIVESRAEEYLENLIIESSEKFHDIACVVLNSLVRLDESKIRNFEFLFIDLVKRTLLKDVEKAVNHSIIVIADSNVGREE